MLLFRYTQKSRFIFESERDDRCINILNGFGCACFVCYFA